MPQFVSFEQIASLLDVPPKSIAWLTGKGMPKEARGQYDVGRCFHWYVRYLHEQMGRRGATAEEQDSGVNVRMHRCRLLKAQADLSELDMLERSGKVIPVGLYEKLLIGWAVTIRQRVLALPARLASQLVGLGRRDIHDCIDREAREMLLILKEEGQGDRNGTAARRDDAPGKGRKPALEETLK
jgi:phage terminase Nu1 subunit (DNA packaging protein)